MRLQEIVDELARTLGRSVVVNDLDYAPLAASEQEDDVDEMRMRALLKRRTPEEVRLYLEDLRIRQIRQPTSVPLAPFGGQERLAVPIRSGEQIIALMWLITGGKPPLRSADYAAIDAACDLIRVVIEQDAAGAASDVDAVADRLLSVDEAIARTAFRTAVDRRLFENGPLTTVLAVRIEEPMSEMDQLTLARRLGTHRSPRVLPLGLHRGPLMFVARTRDADAAVALITGELAASGVRSASTGSAALEPTEGDLRPAADRAVIAARIVSRVDSLGGRADIADLGVWALIDSVASDLDAVRIFSPAAHALCTSDDATQRETVQTYLDVGGNVRVACEQLHIHRTTLYYRLDNLPQVVKDALEDGPRRSALHVCMKLYEYHRTRVEALR